jgi:hypothetical protein
MSVADKPKSPSASLKLSVKSKESCPGVPTYSKLENSISGVLGKFSGGLIQEYPNRTKPNNKEE